MSEKEESISTRELWAKMFKSTSLEAWLTEASGANALPAFSEYITRLAECKNEKPSRIIERAGLEPSTGHHLFRGTRNPSRDTVLQLAFGLELDPDGTQELLKIARMSLLHPKVKRDAVIAHCLAHKEGIVAANIYLHENDLPILGG